MLNGWKQIAAYVGREQRTAIRWALERGLPIHRAPGRGRGIVYAIPAEIDEWLATNLEQSSLKYAAFSPPALIDAVNVPIVTVSSTGRWRRKSWRVTALICSGAALLIIGALSLYRSTPVVAATATAYRDPVAQSAYLQAMYDWNLRSPESLGRAVHEFGEAIQREPQVAAAYTGLADTYLLLREDAAIPDADAYPRAEAAARDAAALAPNSAAAQRALAFVAFWWHQDRASARALFARALRLDPGDALTHHWFATALLANGQAQAAMKQIDIARALDPTSQSIIADRGLILLGNERESEGVAVLRSIIRDNPQAAMPHLYMGGYAIKRRDIPDFLRETAIFDRLRGDVQGLAQLDRWRSRGLSTKAVEETMLEDAKRATAISGRDWMRVAEYSAMLGRRDQANDALSRACANHEPEALFAKANFWLMLSLSQREIEKRCFVSSLL